MEKRFFELVGYLSATVSRWRHLDISERHSKRVKSGNEEDTVMWQKIFAFINKIKTLFKNNTLRTMVLNLSHRLELESANDLWERMWVSDFMETLQIPGRCFLNPRALKWPLGGAVFQEGWEILEKPRVYLGQAGTWRRGSSSVDKPSKKSDLIYV